MEYTETYLTEFKRYIASQTSSVNTVKNYASDLRLFLNFITKVQQLNLDPQTLPSYLTQNYFSVYEKYLVQTNPPSTAKRRISSLKKFVDYCATQGIYPAPEDMPPIPPRSEPIVQSMPEINPDYVDISTVSFPPDVPPVADPIDSIREVEPEPEPIPDLFDPIPPSVPVFVPAEIIPEPAPVKDNPGFDLAPFIVSVIGFLSGFFLTLVISSLLSK